jgi:hypothetical protein
LSQERKSETACQVTSAEEGEATVEQEGLVQRAIVTRTWIEAPSVPVRGW